MCDSCCTDLEDTLRAGEVRGQLESYFVVTVEMADNVFEARTVSQEKWVTEK